MFDSNKTVNDWIVLTLENVSTINPTVVTLFDIGLNYGGGSTGFTSAAFTFNPSATAVWRITTTTEVKNFSGSFLTMDEVVATFNAYFNDDGGNIFSYSPLVGNTTTLIAFSSSYTFVSVGPNGEAAALFASVASTVVAGTTANISSQSSTVDLNSQTQELAFNPYLLDKVNVYASSLGQANQQFQLIDKRPNGVKRNTFKHPTVNPVQPQFALQNIELNYRPTPTNKLEYTLLANETLTLIFNYKGAPIEEYIKSIPLSESKTPTKMNYYQINNPMIDIVARSNRGKVTISDAVKEFILADREINEEEVFLAFTGSDMTEED